MNAHPTGAVARCDQEFPAFAGMTCEGCRAIDGPRCGDPTGVMGTLCQPNPKNLGAMRRWRPHRRAGGGPAIARRRSKLRLDSARGRCERRLGFAHLKCLILQILQNTVSLKSQNHARQALG